ncbi:DUF6199 family natural product biosynthesis protein [Cohnella terricola]|uniref:DUF6199 domain-containing protein n=1 Tax=Cohnella terricola TaxID=1289167 RepID=A0A559J658_9BACL|nr:DUF6199 family natural product biosynthesis protein [Cohnella terricola]TVX95306.1 hypothetical protein FPZ45_23670 [Cohnella terricola]
MFFFAFLFIVISILNIIFPKIGWYLKYGWAVKGDVEPSDAYLLMSRVMGVIILIIFLFVFLPNM